MTLVRPSLLLGERTTRRPLEHFSAPLLKWMPAKWRAIEGKAVARALMNHAFSPEPKASVTVLDAEELRAWGSPAACAGATRLSLRLSSQTMDNLIAAAVPD